MTCFLTSVRVLRMKTLVVVYDPPRTPPLGLLGPLAPFFLLQPLCGGDISTTVSAYFESTGIMLAWAVGGGKCSSRDLRSMTRLFSLIFSLIFTRFKEKENKFVSPFIITILHCNTSIMMKNCTKNCREEVVRRK